MHDKLLVGWWAPDIVLECSWDITDVAQSEKKKQHL